MQNTKQFLLFLFCFSCLLGGVMGQPVITFDLDDEYGSSITPCENSDLVLWVETDSNDVYTFTWEEKIGTTIDTIHSGLGSNSIILSNITDDDGADIEYLVRIENSANQTTTSATLTFPFNSTSGATLNFTNAINSPLQVCEGDLLGLNATIFDPGPPQTSITPNGQIRWYAGDNQNSLHFVGSASVGNGLIVDPDTIGSEVVMQFRRNSSGCYGVVNTSSVSVNPPPTVDGGSNPIFCSNDPNYDFDTHNVNPTGGDWIDPDDIINNNNVLDPKPGNVGVHTLIYSFTDGNGCTNTDTITVTINAAPNADADPDNTKEACLGDPDITLNPSTSSGTGIWLNPPTQLNTSNNTFSTSTAINTVLTYEVTDNGCTDSDDVTVIVHPLPTVNAGSNQSVCENDDPIDLGGSTNGNGVWSGTGVDGSDFDPSLVNPSNSPFLVTFTATSSEGCVNIDTKNITVHEAPGLPDVTANTIPCEGGLVILTASGISNADYKWYSDAALTNEIGDQDTLHIPSATLTEKVFVTATNNNDCTGDALEFSVPVYKNPTAGISLVSSSELCEPNAHEFNASTSSNGTGAINSIQWNFGDNNTSSSNDISDLVSYSYTNSGNYQLTLTITDVNGCMDTETQTLILNPLPSRIPPTQLDSSFCVNGGLADPSKPDQATYVYTWTGECITQDGKFDPTCSGTISSEITQAIPKMVNVHIQNDETGCEATFDHTFFVRPKPIADFVIDDVCQFASFSPVDSSKNEPNRWIWTLDGDTDNSFDSNSSQEPEYDGFESIADAGPHILELIVRNGTCADTVTETFDMYGLPDARTRVSIPDDPCPNVDVELRASNSNATHDGILRYIWDFGDGTMSDTTLENSIMHQYTESNPDLRYSVIVGELHANGLVCYDTASRSMEILPKPTASFAVDSSLCYTELAVFSESSTAGGNADIVQWEWDLGDSTLVDQRVPDDHFYMLPEPIASSVSYAVSLRVEDENECFDHASQTVNVDYSGPTITDAPLKLGDDLLVSRDDGANVTYQWYKIESGEEVMITEDGTRQFYCVKENERSLDFIVKTQNNGAGCETRSTPASIQGREGLPLSYFFPRGMTVYPNPNQGNFSIEFMHEIIGAGELAIYDMAGRTVHRQFFSKDGSFYTLKVNTAGLAEGLYTVDIRLPNKVWFSRRMMVR